MPRVRVCVLTLISIVTILIYTVPFVNILQVGNDDCQMTYMYQYPQFIQISSDDDDSIFKDRYMLFAYAEGRYIERVRDLKFTGVPVLFIPGHGGSYRQVRSLATMTQRLTASRSIFHFDFYAVNFNHEYNGLYGGTLKEQTHFVAESIARILEFYRGSTKPKSVIIVAHSMGGIISFGMYGLSKFDGSSVQLIITLATPFTPVIMMDYHINYYYNNVLLVQWIDRDYKKKWPHLTVISIGAGFKDLQVPPGLSYTEHADINVVTSGIPSVGTSTDHSSILWCKSLMKVLARALYDSVDISKRGVTTDKSTLVEIFNYHLVQTTNGKHWSPNLHEKIIFLDSYTKWGEKSGTQNSFYLANGVSTQSYVMIELLEDRRYDHILVHAYNVGDQNWIGACRATESSKFNYSYCERTENLSENGRTGYGGNYQRKYVNLNLQTLLNKRMTHLVILLRSTEDAITINFDNYAIKDRTVKLDTRIEQTIIKETAEKALFYFIVFENIPFRWEVFDVFLLPQRCYAHKPHAMLQFRIPWSNDGSYLIVESEHPPPFKISLESGAPKHNTKKLALFLFLDSKCTYKATIKQNWPDTLVLLAVRHVPHLLCNIITLLLFVIWYQHMKLSVSHICPSIHEILTNWKFILMLCIKEIVMYYLISILIKLRIWDSSERNETSTEDYIISIYLFTFSYAIVFLTTLWIKFSVSICGVLWSRSNMRDLCDFLYSYIYPYWIPFVNIGVMLLIFVNVCTCSGMTFIVGFLYYFGILCNLSADCQKDQINTVDAKRLRNIESVINFHIPIFLYWYLMTLWNLPTAFTWRNNISLDPWPIENPHGFAVIVIAIGLIWQINNLTTDIEVRFSYSMISYIIFVTALLVPSLASVNIFNILLISSPAFMCIGFNKFVQFCHTNRQSRWNTIFVP